ncbi:MAG: ATPase domain-containing protein [Euryarchaeota archaeon]|nr:ATPase domain-containing protein [Euryarchaeota archaeon]
MERIKTYIERLDEQLEGGIPKGTVSLVCGTPGCMKSSLAYSILYKNAVKGNLKGLYITFEQEIESLKEQMETLGMAEESENLVIVDHDMIDHELGVDMRFELNSIKKAQCFLEDYLKREDFDLLAIDPINALYSLTGIKNPRRAIYNFFVELRRMGVTSLVVSEMHQGDNRFGKYGVEDFLADAIIHLDYRRERDILERYIAVIKMRFTNHNLQYYPLFYNKDGFIIYTKEEIEL